MANLEPGRYERVSSGLICSCIEEYGPHALVPLQETLGDVVAADRAGYRLRGPMESPPSALAVDLAVDRIRELEERVSALESWQADLGRYICEHAPARVEAEYDMAWRLLCETARDRYKDVQRLVLRAISDRKREAHLSGMDRRP